METNLTPANTSEPLSDSHSLNNDVLSRIFDYLPASAIYRARLTCNRIKNYALKLVSSLSFDGTRLSDIPEENQLISLTIRLQTLGAIVDSPVTLLESQRKFSRLQSLEISCQSSGDARNCLRVASRFSTLKTLRINLNIKAPDYFGTPKNIVPMPNLETLFYPGEPAFNDDDDDPHKDFSAFFPSLRVLAVLKSIIGLPWALEVKRKLPNVNIYSTEGVSAVAIILCQERSIPPEITQIGDINQRDLFSDRTPLVHVLLSPDEDSKPSTKPAGLLDLGADPLTRVHYDLFKKGSDSVLTNPERPISLLMLSLLRSHPIATRIWPPYCAEVSNLTTNEWVDREPIHPIVIGLAYGGYYGLASLILRVKTGWDWIGTRQREGNSETIDFASTLIVQVLLQVRETSYSELFLHLREIAPNPLELLFNCPGVFHNLAACLPSGKISTLMSLPFVKLGAPPVADIPSTTFKSVHFDLGKYIDVETGALQMFRVSLNPVHSLLELCTVGLEPCIRYLQKYLLSHGGVDLVVKFVAENHLYMNRAFSLLLRDCSQIGASGEETSAPFIISNDHVELLCKIVLGSLRRLAPRAPASLSRFLAVLSATNASYLSSQEFYDLLWDDNKLLIEFKDFFVHLHRIPMPSTPHSLAQLVSIRDFEEIPSAIYCRAILELMALQEKYDYTEPAYPEFANLLYERRMVHHIYSRTDQMDESLDSWKSHMQHPWAMVLNKVIAHCVPPLPAERLVSYVMYGIRIAASVQTTRKLCSEIPVSDKASAMLWSAVILSSSDKKIIFSLIHQANALAEEGYYCRFSEISRMKTTSARVAPKILEKYIELHTGKIEWKADDVVAMLRVVSWNEIATAPSAVKIEFTMLWKSLLSLQPLVKSPHGSDLLFDDAEFQNSFLDRILSTAEDKQLNLKSIAPTLVRAGLFDKVTKLSKSPTEPWKAIFASSNRLIDLIKSVKSNLDEGSDNDAFPKPIHENESFAANFCSFDEMKQAATSSPFPKNALFGSHMAFGFGAEPASAVAQLQTPTNPFGSPLTQPLVPQSSFNMGSAESSPFGRPASADPLSLSQNPFATATTSAALGPVISEQNPFTKSNSEHFVGPAEASSNATLFSFTTPSEGSTGSFFSTRPGSNSKYKKKRI